MLCLGSGSPRTFSLLLPSGLALCPSASRRRAEGKGGRTCDFISLLRPPRPGRDQSQSPPRARVDRPSSSNRCTHPPLRHTAHGPLSHVAPRVCAFSCTHLSPPLTLVHARTHTHSCAPSSLQALSPHLRALSRVTHSSRASCEQRPNECVGSGVEAGERAAGSLHLWPSLTSRGSV